MKTTIQNKLQKSQKFARKISVTDFLYSQTIFLRFTVILFHSNLDEKKRTTSKKVTRNEQKLTSSEQKVMNSKQKLTCNEQWAESSALLHDKRLHDKKFKRIKRIRNYLPSVNLSLRCWFSETAIHRCFSE